MDRRSDFGDSGGVSDLGSDAEGQPLTVDKMLTNVMGAFAPILNKVNESMAAPPPPGVTDGTNDGV